MQLVNPLKSIIVLAVFFASFSSCNKNCEPEFVDSFNPDTLYASEYLGAYPGSWREYDNGKLEECTVWENVPRYTSVMNSDGCEQIFRDYIIVPKMNGKYVDGDFVMSTSEFTNESTLTRKVGELGDSWGHKTYFDDSAWGPGHHKYRWSIASLLDFKEVNGVVYEDVLVVHYEYSIYYDHNWGGPPPDDTYYYYARNVGLIQYELFINNGYGNPPDEEYGLADYYIAPH